MSLIAQWDTYRQDGNIRTGNHSIEIMDTQGNLSGEFSIDFTSGGFQLTTAGKPKDRWPTIQPRSLTFTMQVRTAAQYQLVESIGTSRDSYRFIVTYRRGARPVFVGVILTSGTTFINNAPITINLGTYYDGTFTITAIDGLTMLQRQRVGINPSEFRKKFSGPAGWFRDIFRYMPTLPYLVGAPFLFQTSWVPDNGDANFIDSQTVAADAFHDKQARLGESQFMSGWDMLTMFCEAFNMRCVSVYGFYLFQQLEDLDAPAYQYDKQFNYIGTNVLPNYITDLEVDMLEMRAPEVTSWEPPIREATVIYKADFNGNLLLGNKFDLTTATSVCYTDISNVTVKTSLERLRIIGSIEFTPYAGNYSGLVRIIFFMQIKVGSNYYVRDITNADYYRPTYGVPQWTTTPGYYYEVYDPLVTMPDEDGRKFYIPIFFSTHRLELAWDDDPLTVCFGYELYGFDENTPADAYGYQLTTKAELDLQAFLMDADVAILDQEDNLVEPVEKRVNIVENENNEGEISRTILFSSGPNKSSKSRLTDDSTPPVDTIDWTVPGLGTDLHYNILVKSLLARGIESATFMGTLLEGPYQETTRLRACGAEWVWWTGRYYHHEHQEFHQGEFLRVKVLPSSTSIVEQDKYDIVERPPVPTRAIAGDPEVVEREVIGITGNTINADTYNIPMPNTDGWTKEQIRSVVTYNRAGNVQRYVDPPTNVPMFAWDNANRNFVLPEKSQAHIWHVFRIHF